MKTDVTGENREEVLVVGNWKSMTFFWWDNFLKTSAGCAEMVLASGSQGLQEFNPPLLIRFAK